MTVSDGLQVQRVHLHLAEWREIITAGAPLPDVPDVGLVTALATAPAVSATALSSERIDAAGLRPWVQLPAQHGFPIGPANLLAPATAAQARDLIAADMDQQWASELAAVCGAAAWWVGFFTIIRHRGVHHLSLEQAKPDVALTVLEEAAGVVALGVAIRVLEEHLRTRGVADRQARQAYCRALATSVAVERRMPELLAGLAELRLVDLVSLAVPWRGRFTKYAGGTGAGQVE